MAGGYSNPIGGDARTMGDTGDTRSWTWLEAQHRYEDWSRHGIWNKLSGLFGRHSRCLVDLATALRGKTERSRYFAGSYTVPIARICGSEGRSADFDADFRPTSTHGRQRWINLAAAWEQGIALPPVELIAVGDSYYVRDGHNRISVARANGLSQIEALVTRIELEEPLALETAPCCA